VHMDKVERVQRRLIRYALRGLGWTDTYDLPPSLRVYVQIVEFMLIGHRNDEITK
jgi:hypothetical protein